jgi:hypothetical protein
MRGNDVGGGLNELDQDALTALGSVCRALGMDEADVVARRAATDPACGETNALHREPFDGASEIVDPKTDVVERWLGDVRPCIRVDRLHEVDLHGERSQAGSKRVFFDVLARNSMARRSFEAEEIHPEACEPLFVRSAERDLLHPEDAKRASLAQ